MEVEYDEADHITDGRQLWLPIPRGTPLCAEIPERPWRMAAQAGQLA